jgi:large conductance mechanosensitive channel
MGFFKTGFLQKFKQFAVKGNVVNLAVGIIIGTEFNKIVTSLVNDVIMPPLGLVISGMKFNEKKWILKPAKQVGKEVQNAITLNYGNFLQACINFMIIALAVFILVQLYETLQTKEKEGEKPPALNKTEQTLIEIRDILKSLQKPS